MFLAFCVQTLKPDGAIYAFLKIDGVTDARRTALDIVDKSGLPYQLTAMGTLMSG